MITPLTTPSEAAIQGDMKPMLNPATLRISAFSPLNNRYVATNPPIIVIPAALHVEILRSL